MRTAAALIPEVFAMAPIGHSGARSEVAAARPAGKAGTPSSMERRAGARAEARAAWTTGEPTVSVATFGAARKPASTAERRTIAVAMSAEGEAGTVTGTSPTLPRPAGPVIPIAASPAFAAAAGAGATRTWVVPVGTITVIPVPIGAFAIGAFPLRAVTVRTVSVRTAAGAAVVIAAAVVVAGFGPPWGAVPRLGPRGCQGTDREGGRHQEQERAAHVILLSC